MLTLFLAAIFTYTLHTKDVFQPPKPPASDAWKSAPAHRESISFQTTEGFVLRGWLYRSHRDAAPYVLFFYGSNEDLAHEAARLAWLRDSFHVNALCFDYPGYGFSGGSVDIGAIRSAALQEFDYTRSHLAMRAPIVPYGWSIGTGMALYVAGRRTVAGLILQAPPSSAAAIERWSSRHDLPWFAHGIVKIKADSSVRNLYEGAAAIRRIDCPLLVVHGQLDDVVPIAQGREVFNASPAAQKQFVEVPGAHHNDLRYTAPPAADAVGAFLAPLFRVQ